MAKSKLYYWNRDWPGHVGFCIDLEAMSGGETRVPNCRWARPGWAIT